MIDYARPYEMNMCDLYPPTPPTSARLDDFQVFKKGNASYIYGNYYNNYDVYPEPEMDTTANVYHNLVSSREYRHEDWKSKVIVDWTDDDTVSWLIECAVSQGFCEFDVPFYNFKVCGVELSNMRREEVIQRMAHPNVDQNISKKIGEIVYDRLQARLSEEIHRQSSVFRYAESDPYTQQETVPSVLDLDKHRLYTSDYKPNDSSLLPASDSSDDAEDVFRTSAPASPFSYGSDSKSGDEEEKRKIPKRLPGRPKGSGKNRFKRPRSVSVPEFLRNLLFDERYCPSIIKWEDYSQGKFRFVKPDEVAKLWGQMKQNDNMTFEKFSRAMRYHYRQNVLVSVPTARLVYQFGHKGPDFKTQNPNFVKVKSELDLQDMPYS
ncbi:unnamed protein product [Danaus chrysippus]|uniref:(African queen) hypothetical protein n=1 Tax=Danaus chrysippus TaxID=151541 RepID=A0A8J2VXA2_9NEOP|nr:unnamed protein product [Danaus chrysippus]